MDSSCWMSAPGTLLRPDWLIWVCGSARGQAGATRSTSCSTMKLLQTTSVGRSGVLWTSGWRPGGLAPRSPRIRLVGRISKRADPRGAPPGSKTPADWLLRAIFMLGGASLFVVLSVIFIQRIETRRDRSATSPKIEAPRMPPSAQFLDLLRDPEFRKLPVEAQLYGLGQTDPEFGKLPAEVQQAVLDDPEYKPGRPITPGKDGRLVRVPLQVLPPTGANIVRPRGPQLGYSQDPTERGCTLWCAWRVLLIPDQRDAWSSSGPAMNSS